MRNLISILCIIVLIPLNLISQTTIRNGVVEDRRAGEIISNLNATLSKEYPVSLDYSVSSKEDSFTMKGSLTINKEKYYGTYDKDEIYSNGVSVWIYQREVNEVTINNASEVDNEVLNISKFLADAKIKFRPKLIREEAGNHIIDLIPRTKSQFSKIRIYASKSTNRLTKIEVSYHKGDKFIYKISNYKPKVKVSESMFSFNPNKFPGVIIVDLR